MQILTPCVYTHGKSGWHNEQALHRFQKTLDHIMARATIRQVRALPITSERQEGESTHECFACVVGFAAVGLCIRGQVLIAHAHACLRSGAATRACNGAQVDCRQRPIRGLVASCCTGRCLLGMVRLKSNVSIGLWVCSAVFVVVRSVLVRLCCGGRKPTLHACVKIWMKGECVRGGERL